MANKTDIVVRIQAEQSRLKRQLSQARSEMKRTQGTFSKLGKQIQGSLLLAFGGAAVMRGIGQAIGVMKDFEFQMDKVAAISGATASEMKQLEKNARSVGAASSFTATQIGQLQEEFARLGFSTQQIIKMTDATRKLALVADADLGESAKAVGATINAFNLSAEESTRVTNVMAESFSKSALNLEKYEVAMSFAAASGKAFGLTVEEVTSMIGVLIDNGIQASKAGTGLRDIFSDLTKSGMTLEEALEEVTTSENKLKTALDLVGKTSANQLVILSENTTKVKELTTALSDTNIELERMASIMEDNLQTDLAEMKSAFEGLILAMGGPELMRQLVRGTTFWLNTLSGADDTIEGITAEIDFLRKKLDDAPSGFREHLERDIDKLTAKLKTLKEEAAPITGGLADPGFESFDFDKFNEGVETRSRSNKRKNLGAIPAIPSIDAITTIPSIIEETQVSTEQVFQKWANSLSQQFDHINEQFQRLAPIVNDSFMAFTDVITAAVRGDSIGDVLKSFFTSVAKQAGQGYVQAGLKYFAAAKLNMAQAALLNAAIPGAGAGHLVMAQKNKALGIQSAGKGIALGAAGGILTGLVGGGGRGGSGSGSGGFRGGFEGTANQQVQISGELRAQGSELVTVFNNYNNSASRRQG